MKYQEDKIDGKEIYNGKVISLRVDRVKLPNGKESFREEISHNGGVGVLVVKDGKALIVKQFRYAYKEELAEIPAGKLEKGELPEMAGIRELEEETGIKANSLKYLTCIYPTPGYTNEKLYLYLCEDFTFGKQKLDEDEFLSYEWVPLNELYEKIKDGSIKDAKTICSLLMYRTKIYE